MTCSWVPQSVDASLSMKMGAKETLLSYANKYWELYNEISGGNEKVAANTFRLGLPQDSELKRFTDHEAPRKYASANEAN